MADKHKDGSQQRKPEKDEENLTLGDLEEQERETGRVDEEKIRVLGKLFALADQMKVPAFNAAGKLNDSIQSLVLIGKAIEKGFNAYARQAIRKDPAAQALIKSGRRGKRNPIRADLTKRLSEELGEARIKAKPGPAEAVFDASLPTALLQEDDTINQVIAAVNRHYKKSGPRTHTRDATGLLFKDIDQAYSAFSKAQATWTQEESGFAQGYLHAAAIWPDIRDQWYRDHSSEGEEKSVGVPASFDPILDIEGEAAATANLPVHQRQERGVEVDRSRKEGGGLVITVKKRDSVDHVHIPESRLNTDVSTAALGACVRPEEIKLLLGIYIRIFELTNTPGKAKPSTEQSFIFKSERELTAAAGFENPGSATTRLVQRALLNLTRKDYTIGPLKLPFYDRKARETVLKDIRITGTILHKDATASFVEDAAGLPICGEVRLNKYLAPLGEVGLYAIIEKDSLHLPGDLLRTYLSIMTLARTLSKALAEREEGAPILFEVSARALATRGGIMNAKYVGRAKKRLGSHLEKLADYGYIGPNTKADGERVVIELNPNLDSTKRLLEIGQSAIGKLEEKKRVGSKKKK